MSYISEIRKKVGHDPIIYAGATVLVFNEKGELLLNLRSDTGDWGIPGGGKELGETLEECAVRELKEETDLDADALELVAVLSGDAYHYSYPNGDEVDTIIALYRVRNYSGRLNINDGESTELRFFPLDCLPKLESRAKAIIDRLISGEIKL
ncbi:ADP-ribose pyrophosphatase YjhB, NUDIX family [Ruminococcus sp. YRD2003]|uniref:NUDIX hydrolase n=1 Tax=Ruminococcus sp. YRD2003 TaxID=1452313 RepID=UPI0008C2444F|nr:ADP-ribose pyrophosphatase YjhB, NUDIX family [Ruminococcus flavefaciens]